MPSPRQMLTPLGGEEGKIWDSVAIEVGDAHHLSGGAGRNGDRIGEAAAAQAREQIERDRAGVARQKIGRAPDVNAPAATAVVASVLVTTGEPELVSICR